MDALLLDLDGLIGRLQSRAADPERRVDAPRTGFDNRNGAALAGFAAQVAPLLGDLGGILRAARANDVRPGMREQLDRRVANGGFGPAGGLMGLGDAVAAWQDLRAASPGPRGTRWPEQLPDRG